MNYYEVKVVYDKQTGEDNPGKVKEAYLVPAMTPSEAESIVLEEIKPFIFGDCEVPQIRKRLFFDIFKSAGGEFWYEAKVEMITVDGDSEVHKPVAMLVQEDTIHAALKELKLKLGSYDHEIIQIKKSLIVDVIENPSNSGE